MSDTPMKEPTHPLEATREERAVQPHRHRGKSSEALLDKAAILQTLEILPNQTILDAGCGDGYMSKAFLIAMNNTGTVYALDPDEQAIAALRNETLDGNIQAIVGDAAAATAIADASIDLLYLANVLHGFTPDQMSGFCDEVVRVLKPGGRLAIVEIDKRDTPFGPPLSIRLSPDELQQRIPLIPRSLVRAGEYFYLQTFENAH